MRTLAVLATGMLILMALPVSADLSAPTFGAPVTDATTDFRPTLTNIDITGPGAFLARWDRGTIGDPTDDCFYIHFGAATDTKLVSGDIRLGGKTGDCPAGVLLDASSTEVASNINIVDYTGAGNLKDFRTLMTWLEVDGKPGLSSGDMIYLDLSNAAAGCSGAAGTLGTCDIRLRTLSTPSATFGTIVKAGEADLNEAGDNDGVLPDTTTLTDFTDANIQLHYFDEDESGGRDLGDSVYLRMTDGAPATQIGAANWGAFVPFTFDIRLTAYGSNSAGSPVVAGNNDHVPTLEAAPAAKIGRVKGTSDIEDKLFIHWGAGTTHVQIGDIAINTVSGQTAGTLVTSTSNGAGLALNDVSTADVSAHVYFVDTNSNGRFDSADAVYLNKPDEIGGEADALGITAEDIRLRSFSFGGSSFSAGSVVKTGDADLGASGLAATALTLKFFDADRSNSDQILSGLLNAKVSGGDTAWATGEAAYIEDAATVENGAIRITAINFAEASAVATGNPDIGRGLTALADVKISGADTTYILGEDVYIEDAATVENGAIRITSVGSYVAGSTATCPGDTDCGTTLNAKAGKVTGPDATFTAGTDMVYFAAGAAVAATDQRATPLVYTSGTTVSCPGSGAVNHDCGAGLNSLANARVTGSDGTWSSGSETVYVSADYLVSAGDTRLSPLTLGAFVKTTPEAVVAADPDAPASKYGTGDGLYLSRTTLTGDASSSKIPNANDVRIIHPGFSFGSSVTTSNTDFTPRLVPIGAGSNAARWDKGETGNLFDDAFYIRVGTGAGTSLQTGDLRIVPVQGENAGSMYQNSGDADNAATLVLDTTAVESRVCYVTPQGSKSANFDSHDFVYLEGTEFSGTGGGALSANDMRLTATTGLSTNYNAGTLVQAADKDRTAFTTCSNAPGAGLSFHLKFVDLDGDGAFDAGGTDNKKVEHIYVGADATTCAIATPCSMILRQSDIPLTGGAVAQAGFNPSSPSSPSSPSTPSSPSSPTTPTTPTSPTSPTTPTMPSTPTYTNTDLANANIALGSSLTVTVQDDMNNLDWDPINGAAGYDVWAANSPFEYIGDTGSDVTMFIDENGNAKTKYIVTAFFTQPDGSTIGRGEGYVGDLPDLPGVDKVEPKTAPEVEDDERSPGAGLILVLAGVAVAFLARRRQ